MIRIAIKVLFLTSVLFLSCKSEKQNYVVIYFDNGIIDDAPLGYPDFSTIEYKNPEMIYQLNDKEVDRYFYLKFVEAIKNGINKKKEDTSVNNNAKIEAIYLELKDLDKMLFFNSFDDFYDDKNKFLFKNKDLANNIRKLINYEKVIIYGVDSDVPSPLYYKIVLQIKNEEI